jgi:hypothetical protein
MMLDRDSFARELDGMRVPQPVGSEPPPHAGVHRELAQFRSGGGR